MGILDNLLGGKRIAALQGVDSIIGENAKFKGELTTSCSVSVNGELEGKVRADGEVIISNGGKVMGEIYGGSVVVSGKVDGHIVTKENLEITKSGRVHGDLTGGKVIIEEGSQYHGKVKVEHSSAEEPLPETIFEPPTQDAPPNF